METEASRYARNASGLDINGTLGDPGLIAVLEGYFEDCVIGVCWRFLYGTDDVDSSAVLEGLFRGSFGCQT
jgi:hypothetical protein